MRISESSARLLQHAHAFVKEQRTEHGYGLGPGIDSSAAGEGGEAATCIMWQCLLVDAP